MPAAHGDLPSTSEHFAALVELLVAGATGALSTTPPAMRAIERPSAGQLRRRPAQRRRRPRSLAAAVARRHARAATSTPRSQAAPRRARAGDGPALRGAADHGRPLRAGPDRRPRGADRHANCSTANSTQRHGTGPLRRAARHRDRGAARAERRSSGGAAACAARWSPASGRYEGALSLGNADRARCAPACCATCCRCVDVLGREDREVPLATLLLGYNSSANLTVAASVEALVRGVIEANEQFSAATGLDDPHRPARHRRALSRHRDHRGLRAAAARAATAAARRGAKDTLLVCSGELMQGEGCASACSTPAAPATGRA